jgi:hypothetical protein
MENVLFGGLAFQLFPAIPLLLMWSTGIVFAVRQLPHNRQNATLLISAFVLLIVQLIISQGFSVSIPILMQEFELDISQISILIGFQSLFSLFMNIAAWVLIFMVLFRKGSKIQ